MSSKRTNNVASPHEQDNYEVEDTKKGKVSPQTAASSVKEDSKDSQTSGASPSSASSTSASSSGSSGSGNMEVRALIDNSSVGGIIGKGGANVKRVREEAGIFVSILKSEYKAPKERVLLLKGAPVAISKGVRMVCEL
jgi:hypothetical protein